MVLKPKTIRYRCAECPRMVVTDRIQNPPAYCTVCRKAKQQFSLAR